MEINPGLDAGEFAEAYARDGVVRIPDFLTPASADRLEAPRLSITGWLRDDPPVRPA